MTTKNGKNKKIKQGEKTYNIRFQENKNKEMTINLMEKISEIHNQKNGQKITIIVFGNIDVHLKIILTFEFPNKSYWKDGEKSFQIYCHLII